MTTFETIIILFCFTNLIIWRKEIFAVAEEVEPVKEHYKITYPLEPMSENYFSIKEHIATCETREDVNTVYIRILIFEGCYDNSAPFTSELFEHYDDREKILFPKKQYK